MFVTTDPESLTAAAAQLGVIGTTVAAGNSAGAAPIMGVVPPAPEPASVLLAAALATHGGVYQATQAVSSVIHAMFVENMSTSAASYAGTEAISTLAL